MTLRMPKGLWADFEASIIQSDRQFLTEVARDCGLPVQEVIRRCLGTGERQAVLVGDDDTAPCPWWDRSRDGLWKPCGRRRLTTTTPCQIHTSCVPGRSTCIRSDPRLHGSPVATPLLWNSEIYWIADAITFCEDGSRSPIQFKTVVFQGSRIYVKAP